MRRGDRIALMPGIARTIVRATVVLIISLVAADIVGVIACTLFDVAPIRANSGALPYAIWLVLGIFCGLTVYGGAGSWALHRDGDTSEWTDHPDANRTGLVIVNTCAAIILALAVLFHRLYWSRGVAGEYFVPDSAPHSVVFLLSVLGAIAGAHFLLVPTRQEVA